MPKPRLSEIQNFGDPLQSDFFELILRPPSGGDTTALRVQCQQVALPAKLIEPVPVELAGNQLMYAGRSLYNHDMQVQFIEDRTMKVHKALKGWVEYCREHDPQTGNFKEKYAVTATLTAFDQMGSASQVFTLYGVWPSNLPEIQFDGSASNVIVLGCTMQVDYWEPAK